MRAVLAVVVFGLIEGVRWLRTRQLPGDTAGKYQQQAAAFRDPLTEPENHWYWSGLSPFPPPGDVSGDEGQSKNWERTIARAQFLGGASHDPSWLLWGIIAGQLIMALPDQPRRRRAALSQRVSLRLPGERAPDGTHPGTPSASGVAG